MADFWGHLQQQLEQSEQQSLRRVRRVLNSPQQVHIRLNGNDCINFCSNDYLGLAGHPQLIEAAQHAFAQSGFGSGASHLVCGHHELHEQLEQTAAKALGRERALLFSTGFAANTAVLSTLLSPQDAIFHDKLNHASLIDGAKLSGARSYRFAHNDMQHLQQRLQTAEKTPARFKMLAVDGVFSMDGDIAPLLELSGIAKQSDSILMVDDAHGLGVLGENGLGSCEHFGLNQNDVPIVMATLGKALGSYGAVVAGPEVLIETLIQRARPYIYSTAMPPAIAAASTQAFNLLQAESFRREHLLALIKNFKTMVASAGLSLLPSDTAIQPLLIGSEQQALEWQAALKEQGFYVSAIRTPTVAKGQARLRITLTANHSQNDIEQLVAALKTLGKRYPLTGKP